MVPLQETKDAYEKTNIESKDMRNITQLDNITPIKGKHIIL